MSKIKTNATIRVRNIDIETFWTVVELLKESSAGVGTELFSTAETRGDLPVMPELYDPTNGDVNHGPMPCPVCKMVDDHPCRFMATTHKDPAIARRLLDRAGDNRVKPHKARIRINLRPISGYKLWSCDRCEFESENADKISQHRFEFWPHHQVRQRLVDIDTGNIAF